MRTIILLLSLGIATGHLFLLENNVNFDMIFCVINIIDIHNVRRTIVFHIEEEMNSILWEKIIKSVKMPFIVGSRNINLHNSEKLLVILFPNVNTNYSNLLQKHPRDTQYITVGTEEFKQEQMKNIFEQFYHMKMFYQILLVPEEDKINIYTSFEYSEKHCANAGPPTVIDSYVKGEFINKYNPFMKGLKYPNIHGCTLICVANMKPPDATLTLGENKEIVFERFSNKLMNIFSEKFNFKPKIILPRDNLTAFFNSSSFFYSDPKEDIMHHLVTEEVDFALGDFSRLPFNSDDGITFGRGARFECYTWAVPIKTGKKRSLLMNYIEAFSFNFWILCTIVFIVSVFTIETITIVLGGNRDLQSPLNAFQYIFSSFLNQPFHVKLRSCSLHIFVTNWLIYVLVITTAYQASLRSLMIIPWEESDLHTLEDLLDSQLKVGGAFNMLVILHMIHKNNKKVKTLIEKFIVLSITDINEIIHRIESERDFAMLGEKRHLRTFSKNIDIIYDKDRIHFLDSCLARSLTTPVLFPFGSPLSDPVNKLLALLLENGILTKFYALPGDIIPSGTVNFQVKNAQSNGKVNLSQLGGIFIVLIINLGLSFIIFVCEIAIKHMFKIE